MFSGFKTISTKSSLQHNGPGQRGTHPSEEQKYRKVDKAHKI